MGNKGLYGISVSNNLNEWTAVDGVVSYVNQWTGVDGVGPRRDMRRGATMEPGDPIRVTLDCTNGSLTFTNERLGWTTTLAGLPAGAAFYPFFDPYDLTFTIMPPGP
jgi:hypothetical protein